MELDLWEFFDITFSELSGKPTLLRIDDGSKYHQGAVILRGRRWRCAKRCGSHFITDHCIGSILPGGNLQHGPRCPQHIVQPGQDVNVMINEYQRRNELEMNLPLAVKQPMQIISSQPDAVPSNEQATSVRDMIKPQHTRLAAKIPTDDTSVEMPVLSEKIKYNHSQEEEKQTLYPQESEVKPVALKSGGKVEASTQVEQEDHVLLHKPILEDDGYGNLSFAGISLSTLKHVQKSIIKQQCMLNQCAAKRHPSTPLAPSLQHNPNVGAIAATPGTAFKLHLHSINCPTGARKQI